MPGANSAYQLLTHCLGMLTQWTRADILGQSVSRDRDTEFTSSGSVEALIDRARAVREQFAHDLGRIDPDNAATYEANAAAATDGIVAVDTEIALLLEPVTDRPIIVFHDAFGYFARHYGLTIAGAIADGDAAAPGAARIAELIMALRACP